MVLLYCLLLKCTHQLLNIVVCENQFCQTRQRLLQIFTYAAGETFDRVTNMQPNKTSQQLWRHKGGFVERLLMPTLCLSKKRYSLCAK